jgi:hypothetical protein
MEWPYPRLSRAGFPRDRKLTPSDACPDPLTALKAPGTVSVRTKAREMRAHMGKEPRMTRMMRTLVAAVVATLLLVAAPAGAQAAGKPVYSCPSGFDGGAQTIEQVLANPRSQAALAAGVVSEAGIRAGFASVDKNGTGRVCVKVSNGLLTSNKPNGQFLLNIVDDNASVR